MKKIVLLVAALTIGIYLGTSALSFAAVVAGKGKMTGSVVDEGTGKPIEGVVVKMFFPDNAVFHEPSPVTGADGKWKAVYISGGRWDLDFVKAGYEVKKLSVTVDTTPGKGLPSIDIKMKKIEGTALVNDILSEIEAAKTLMSQQKIDNALEVLLKIREKYKAEPGVEITDLYIGNCYALKGDYIKAIELFKSSLEKFPNNKEIITSIGNAYNAVNDFDNAITWFEKLDIAAIGNIDTLFNIGVIYYNKGNFEASLKYADKAVEIDPAFADGYYQLGMVYTALNRQKEAVTAFKKFMELAPNSPNVETAKSIIEAFK